MKTETSSILIPSVEMEELEKKKLKKIPKNDFSSIEPKLSKKKVKSHQATKEALPPKTGALVSTKVYKMKYLGEGPQSVNVSTNLTAKNTKSIAQRLASKPSKAMIKQPQATVPIPIVVPDFIQPATSSKTATTARLYFKRR
jgi:hypothetical protein